MTFLTRFFERDFTTFLNPAMGKPQVERMRWKALGGCDQAQVRVSGGAHELFELVSLLRCPIEIYTLQKDPLWWGYVECVDLTFGRLKVSTSLENLANRVCVRYSEVNGAGTTGTMQTTGWVEDTESQDEYGVAELRGNLSQGTAEQAAAEAARLLAEMRYPKLSPSFDGEGMATATLRCAGWWKTLGWQYYSDSSGNEGYEEIGAGLQEFGTAKNVKVAQSFQLASSVGWQANAVRLRMRKSKLPTDNVTVKLCSDSAGAPGTVLATASVTGSGLSDYLNWVDFVLSARVSLATSTTYWITVERSGSTSETNRYAVDTNEELGYTRGAFKIWNGSAWVARVPDTDMVFSVGGVVETSSQISTILTSAGQFISAVEIEAPSGVYSCPYRDGDMTALAAVEELLKSGTSNGQRMLASVDQNRKARIYEEPVSGSSDYLLRSDGRIFDSLDAPIEQFAVSAGMWAKLKDVIPPTADLSQLNWSNVIFIEEVEYDVKTGRLSLKERNAERLTGVR